MMLGRGKSWVMGTKKKPPEPREIFREGCLEEKGPPEESQVEG